MASTSRQGATRVRSSASAPDGTAKVAPDARSGGGDGRPVPDRPAGRPGGRAHLRDTGRLRPPVVQADRGEPDPAGGDDARGQRGVRGRRLCADPRPGLHLRDVLRGRPEHLQQHRGGVRREIAGDRAGRLARALGAGAQPLAPSQGQGIRDAVRGVREDHGRLGRAGQARDRAAGDRPGAGGGRPVQAAGVSRAAEGPGPRPAGQAAPASGGAAAERPRGPARGARRGRRPALGGEASRDPGRRGDPPLRPCRTSCCAWPNRPACRSPRRSWARA